MYFFPMSLFYYYTHTKHLTLLLSGHQMWEGFSSYQAVLCDTSCMSWNLTQFLLALPWESIRSHELRTSLTSLSSLSPLAIQRSISCPGYLYFSSAICSRRFQWVSLGSVNLLEHFQGSLRKHLCLSVY